MSLSAHLWTVWPLVQGAVRPAPAPDGEDWGLEIEDPDVGSVRLSGHLRGADAATDLVVFVHGLGGSAGSR